jgi:alpha-tubulin suppressor-like RCC1 family protein
MIAASGGFGIGTGELASNACAILSDKSLHCWGKNNKGQLGTGDTTDSEVPVAAQLTDVSHVALGGLHTCAIRSNKDLYCWGWNSQGQLGDGTIVDKPAPTKIRTAVNAVDLGFHHTCDIEGLVGWSTYCWGDGFFGQLGDGNGQDSSTPKFVPNLFEAKSIALGNLYTCAVGTTQAACWGANEAGELGNGTTDGSLTPGILSVNNFTLIRAANTTSGGIANGKLYMWGDNSNGALGDNSTNNATVPKDINLPNVVNLALGIGHSCALTNSGQVLCWGAQVTEADGGPPPLKLVPTVVEWPDPT